MSGGYFQKINDADLLSDGIHKIKTMNQNF